MKDEQILKRIEEVYKREGLSPSSFAKKIGFNQSNFSKILRGEREIPANLINKIIDNTNVNIDWLRTGEGNMLKENSNAKQFIPRDRVGVPLVSQYAYAGYLGGYGDPEYVGTLPTIDFTPDREMTGNWLAFEVKGDSMDNGSKESYVEGEIVICREVEREYWRDSRLFINKRDFVIVHEEGILIKRITEHNLDTHTITIHSLNPMYPDRTLNLEHVKQIFSIVESRVQRRR